MATHAALGRHPTSTSDLCDSSCSGPSSSFSSSASSSSADSGSSLPYESRPVDPLAQSGKSLRRVAKHVEEEDVQGEGEEGEGEEEGAEEAAMPQSPAHLSGLCQQLPSTSVETYNSVFSDSASFAVVDDEEAGADASHDHGRADTIPAPTEDDIPPVLPEYRASIIDPHVRPSTPDTFSHLFPSLDRLSIRHDDLTPDGNMNLRVDVLVPRSGRHPVTVQLFHLRMQDLARREFSLRRYCRDSGREVCSSKRAYAQPRPVSRPAIQRSVSSAMNTLRSPFQRSSSSSSSRSSASSSKRPSTGSSSIASTSWDAASMRSMRIRTDSWSGDRPPPPASSLVPTDSIKLEFSNYARIDMTRNRGRHSSIRYDFDWWDHSYSWKRVYDPNLGTTSFHLGRDGRGQTPVAHITPEVRSPNQVEEDEWAGGWIPPCHMWISDERLLEENDVADIIIATGLIALVDDCIKDRWHVKKPSRWANRAMTMDTHANMTSRSLMKGIFHRRHSQNYRGSPIKTAHTVAAY
ncbi:hypothetical protein GMORB2_6540 [Geosmithia morbida]|uniref:Uncharacterized protein n=1 Tax=Geosmithia morbida TaxID=1094350 RepID=A0A9P4YWB5_9HYPO|nr:uncharacterized protein GMORB2_6540 [Geosmithia morbida]KAF4122992.1 hypothetical protein GMORB2_6540 [Geosmithia morbida]